PAPDHPPQAPATEAASAARPTAPSHPPVDVMGMDPAEGRQKLADSFGGGKAAEEGMREIALELKKARGSSDHMAAFQEKYQDRLALPDDFSTAPAGIKRLYKLLGGDVMSKVSVVDPAYGKNTGIGSEDFNARRSSQSSQAAPAA
ncbi:hypothetical protein, partial [Paracidovorax anthurii]